MPIPCSNAPEACSKSLAKVTIKNVLGKNSKERFELFNKLGFSESVSAAQISQYSEHAYR